MIIIKKSSHYINNLHHFITPDEYNQNFDFVNQNYGISFEKDKISDFNDEKYVKVKYLKGKR